ncbi:glycoside hydrolase family 13 protein [Salisediminibacterium halotolerans]|uniref:glycoside hydrolase family 13 protein n=1 Tax=Salisediminibacterium halotolerans TaxID=517425 RepID=UPI000EAE8AA3|nr:alpha-glucosidase [Salisediminibacterium halotolerans]RLJ71802.1 alpha-glucosidase [Actinophytocola xinjiangensis]RPE86952.1 alpha-glucosidase [Salisediminibacterium halotolerans]TWG33015.1 alpha-glucosidase [Salisediminibacterium halotolerans]GEL08912.1 alpha-glucosidase [Salisediminibacterium halotolerans]
MERVWWKEAVGYQIYPRSFQDSNGDGIGDLQGIISRLDYLKQLGIDFIWICPMYKSPLDDNGYDISDYRDILDDFGTMADFDELLNEVHNRGMRLIIDLVPNHTSDEHPWFIESRQSKNSPKRDWYIWRDPKADGSEPNNWESIFGGSAWEYDDKTGQYYLHVFSRRQPDLNWENPDVRQAIYDMINWWLEKGVDGFRIDALSHIKKRPGLPDMPNPKGLTYVPSFKMHMNQEGIHTFLQELKDHTYGNDPNVMTVGEANGVSAKNADEWVGKNNGKMDMVFQFEHLDLWDYEVASDLDVVELKKTLSRWQKGLEHDGWNALFIENHDKARVVSTWGDDTTYWKESATALGAMYFLMKGTPYIYQGQEIGMTNIYFDAIADYDDVAALNFYNEETAAGKDPQEVLEILAHTSRDNSRTPMQWDKTDQAGFTDGTPWMKVNPNYQAGVNTADQTADSDSILSFYRKMIRLKKSADVFTYGSYDLLMPKDEAVFAYRRELNGTTALVITNLTDEQAEWTADKEASALSAQDLQLINYPDYPDHSNALTVSLRPYEARVYLLNSPA